MKILRVVRETDLEDDDIGRPTELKSDGKMGDDNDSVGLGSIPLNSMCLDDTDEGSVSEDDLLLHPTVKIGAVGAHSSVGSMPSLSSICYDSVATEYFMQSMQDSSRLMQDSFSNSTTFGPRHKGALATQVQGQTLDCLNPVMVKDISKKSSLRWDAQDKDEASPQNTLSNKGKDVPACRPPRLIPNGGLTGQRQFSKDMMPAAPRRQTSSRNLYG